MALEKVLALDASGIVEKSINVGAPDGSMVTSSITLTSGQTSVPIPGGYISGGIVVFLNGVYLSPVEYTATDLSNVVLAVGAPSTGSVLDVMVFSLQSLLSISSYMLGMLNAVDAAAARTLLALGTASTATVTTSIIDTTAGRVLKVGDFGLGAVTAPLVLNCNNVRDSGTYIYDSTSGSVNGPSGLAYGSLVDVSFSGSGHPQLFLEYGASRLFTRSSYGGYTAWSPWVEVATSSNSLGHGQTWQNMINRALGVTYTNTAGRPIEVSVTNLSVVSGSVYLRMFIDGVQVSIDATPPYAGFQSYVSASMIVPNGATYSADNAGASGTLAVWSELR